MEPNFPKEGLARRTKGALEQASPRHKLQYPEKSDTNKFYKHLSHKELNIELAQMPSVTRMDQQRHSVQNLFSDLPVKRKMRAQKYIPQRVKEEHLPLAAAGQPTYYVKKVHKDKSTGKLRTSGKQRDQLHGKVVQAV